MSDLVFKHADDRMIASEWFKDHKAAIHEYVNVNSRPGSISKLIWKKPGSSFYQVNYTFDGRLFVCGDLGEAVYQWSEPVDLQFVAHCDLDYFGGKCHASSQEPKGKTWDADRVKRRIEEKLAQWAAENPIDCPKCKALGPDFDDLDYRCGDCKCDGSGSGWWGTVSREPLSFAECSRLTFQEEGKDLESVIGHPAAWAQFLYESEGLIVSCEKVSAAYPRSTFEPSDEYSVGYTWDLRTRAHLIGLKMAWKQLQDAAADAKIRLESRSSRLGICGYCGQPDPPLGTCHCGAR